MKIKQISVPSPSFSSHPILRKELIDNFPNTNIVFNDSGNHYSGPTLIKFLEDSDSVIIGTEIISAGILSSLPNLRMISKYGVGTDNIDFNALLDKDIFFYWKGGVNKTSVAEMTLAFLIGLSRNLFYTNFKLRNGVWHKKGGFQLSGKTIGIIGCGFIGGELIRLLEPFHCKILVYDIVDKMEILKNFRANQVEMIELQQSSDLITLHIPLTPMSEGMINLEFLSKMKKGSFLVNTSRGGVINQRDLLTYLHKFLNGDLDSTLSGAALDVLQNEPSTDSELVNLPNLFITPHIGGNADEAVLAMGRSAIDGLLEYSKK